MAEKGRGQRAKIRGRGEREEADLFPFSGPLSFLLYL
jgi:hypothetical protein